MASHYVKMGYKSVPPVESKTSKPQLWHVPSRTEGLSAKTVDMLKISKVKVPKRKNTADGGQKKMQKRVVEGILPNVYCPVTEPKPEVYINFSRQLTSNLSAFNSCAQIMSLLPDQEEVIVLSPTKFGQFPHGSCISHQQKPTPQTCTDIISIDGLDAFPPFPLPVQTASYNVVLSKPQFDYCAGLQVDETMATQLEVDTRAQTNSKSWHNVRSCRITSSVFKQVCSRQKDFEGLADRLVKTKPIQTKAMRYGIEHEHVAAKHYAAVNGSNVYLSGFVVNPSAPHLGASPDRKVCDPGVFPQYGLLEIKCPDVDSYVECKYLKQSNGTHALKRSHAYYYQIMGQMGLSGMEWCDLFVEARTDFHLERIQFDQQKWLEMKEKLDAFFFMYFLPLLVSK